jgi:hypothetical protein
MWVLILEALLAGGLFVFIIWWTMFSGRRQGERQIGSQDPMPPPEEGPDAASRPHDKPR